MTLPGTTTSATADDLDMFGPSRSPPLRHARPRVPMISAKLRMREERKRILQLCAHKLERIKDSEINLRRSVCINNTYSRLTDEVRHEKYIRYLSNLPKSDSTSPESQNDYENSYHHLSEVLLNSSEVPFDELSTHSMSKQFIPSTSHHQRQQKQPSNTTASDFPSSSTLYRASSTPTSCSTSNSLSQPTCDDSDLEILDRELNSLDASMPLTDPEISQGIEQLEKATSRKRQRSEEEDNDRLVQEALSQFYLPSPRLLSEIDDCPVVGVPDAKRSRAFSSINMLNSDDSIDSDQNSMDFEVIMDALRLGSGSNNDNCNTNNDSCGQAALMSENGIFHNLLLASLET